jgi:hypothetical protein
MAARAELVAALAKWLSPHFDRQLRSESKNDH